MLRFHWKWTENCLCTYIDTSIHLTTGKPLFKGQRKISHKSWKIVKNPLNQQIVLFAYFRKKNPLNRGLPVLDNGFVICEKFMAAIWILVFYIHRKVQYEFFHWHFHKTHGVLNLNEHIFCKSKKRHKREEESFLFPAQTIHFITTMLLHFFPNTQNTWHILGLLDTVGSYNDRIHNE